VEVVRTGSFPRDDSKLFSIHRTLGPSLGLSASHVHVGAELLPEGDRPAHGGGVVLLWAPLFPSRCLFTARDASGTYRILSAPEAGSELLARTLEQLEVECAWAFEEALAATPHHAELVRHLDAALEHAAVAALLFGDTVTGRPFWQRATL
jgi:hypothetical protein